MRVFFVQNLYKNVNSSTIITPQKQGEGVVLVVYIPWRKEKQTDEGLQRVTKLWGGSPRHLPGESRPHAVLFVPSAGTFQSGEVNYGPGNASSDGGRVGSWPKVAGQTLLRLGKVLYPDLGEGTQVYANTHPRGAVCFRFVAYHSMPRVPSKNQKKELQAHSVLLSALKPRDSSHHAGTKPTLPQPLRQAPHLCPSSPTPSSHIALLASPQPKLLLPWGLCSHCSWAQNTFSSALPEAGSSHPLGLSQCLLPKDFPTPASQIAISPPPGLGLRSVLFSS